MCRVALLLITSLFLSYLAMDSQVVLLDKNLHEKCLYPTIQIIAEDESAYGSGVIIRSEKVGDKYLNFFLSSNHIFEPQTFNVILHKYKDWSTVVDTVKYPCRIYAHNKENDLAIGAFISKEKMPVAEINMEAKFYIGTEVTKVGCGLGDIPRFEKGIVTSPNMPTGYITKDTVRATIHTVPGDSGGPLFYKNKVVGITKAIKFWRDQLIFNQGYFVPINEFKKWSDDNNQEYHFIWDSNKKTSLIIYYKLIFDQYETKSFNTI